MKRSIAFIIVFLFTAVLFSQNRAELTNNPRKTVETFQKYLDEAEYDPSIAALTLNIKDAGNKKSQDLAIKLKKVMDARGLYFNLTDIPNDSDYLDTLTETHKFVPFKVVPDIYLKKTGNNWLFSKETVNNIPEFYRDTFPVELSGLKALFPESFFNKFMGMQVWKYIGIGVYLLFGFILYKLVSWIIGLFLTRGLKRLLKSDEVIKKYINPISDPLSFLVVLFLIHLFLPLLEIPVSFNQYIIYLYQALLPITVTLIAYRLSDLFADFYATIADKTATTIDDQLVPLVRKLIKAVIVILGFFYLLTNFGVEITPLLAGASVGGLAFALAAQDTVKNLFGSITIYTDQPFEIGDWIEFDGGGGVVEEIRVRSTRIRTFHNSLISIPNGKLADMKVDNMGRRVYRRFTTTIGITYDTPPDLIEAFITGLKEIVKEHPRTRKDVFEIHLNEYGPSSLNILVYIFFHVENWSEELKARQNFILESIRLAEELGVRFAFPTSTIHVEEIPGEQSLTPRYDGDRDSFFKKVDNFIGGRKGEYKSKF